MALVIQLVDRMCNDCFKLKHLFLLSLDLVDILVKNVDELGSEHHVRTHINEPPCFFLFSAIGHHCFRVDYRDNDIFNERIRTVFKISF